ncbi:MAG: zinc-finger domain-containing protein [Rhodospirillaceae bacterium]|nr:zinc-finger domain-containing protein [Rhodospirillaceae bacterium]MDE0362961.1 zinc-finger domain-containing protein [Rhodospirillaceae bacterium]
MRIRTGRVEETLKPANAQRQVQVTARQLPLHCPLPGTYLWNSHPKVYLPIEATGTAVCPYCGTRYILVDET